MFKYIHIHITVLELPEFEQFLGCVNGALCLHKAKQYKETRNWHRYILFEHKHECSQVGEGKNKNFKMNIRGGF